MARSESKGSLGGIDALIVAGETSTARRLLVSCAVPGDELSRVRLASLLRRAGMCERALSVLHADLFPEQPGHCVRSAKARTTGHVMRSTPSSAVVVEYALNLARLGGAIQAQSLLADAQEAEGPAHNPDLLYALAATATTAWDYVGARRAFEKWLDGRDPEEYRTIVGRLNHAHCCIRLGDTGAAARSLAGLRGITASRGWTLLGANVSDLEARILFLEGLYDDALALLGPTASALADHGLSDRLNVLRLQAMITWKRDRVRGRRALEEVRTLARACRHGETEREIDLFLAGSAGDVPCATRVLFGSPHPWFRDQARTSSVELPSEWAFRGDSFDPAPSLGALRRASRELLRLTGETFAATGRSPVTARLLTALASDFYRAWSLVALHLAVFPERLFHPVHSANLVRAHVSRLRFLLDPGVARVVLGPGGYRLELASGFVAMRNPWEGNSSHRVTRGAAPVGHGAPRGRTFSVTQYAADNGMSLRSAQRSLAAGVREGRLRRHGRGPATRYELTGG